MTQNNRLLSYTVKRPVGGVPTTLRTVRYTYYKTGDVSNVTVKDEFISGVTPGSAADYDWHYDLAFYYITNGSLRFAVSGKWQLDPNDVPDPDSYVPISAKEFRFDSPRARYLAVEYDCHGSANQANWTVVGDALHWTDYTGDIPATDADITAAGGGAFTFTDETDYFGLAGQQPADASAETYYHGDLIASTTMTTDEDGGSLAAPATTAYTAFGEVVPAQAALGTRYQYAGGFGYESGLLSVQGANTAQPPITLQHLGARWYQPSVGRFIERDPMGIEGGINVYGYCEAEPLARIDPQGEYWVETGPGWARWVINLTGGGGRVPVMDPGPAQTAVVTTTTIISLAAPVGVGARVVTLGGRGVRAAQAAGGPITKACLRLRRYIRYDGPHHGKPAGWDGRWFGGR